jgi:uncharacterized OsmC-like protein
MGADLQSVRLAQVEDYRFDATFGPALPTLQVDEPPPLGQGLGPSPVQLLAAAVGNCLSASLLFALRKFKLEAGPLTCDVVAEVGRNAEGRVRVLGLQATLTLAAPGDTLPHLDRVLAGFEAYCTVTQSVSPGIPVTVRVLDSQGNMWT